MVIFTTIVSVSHHFNELNEVGRLLHFNLKCFKSVAYCLIVRWHDYCNSPNVAGIYR
jgi:hypothetical protein